MPNIKTHMVFSPYLPWLFFDYFYISFVIQRINFFFLKMKKLFFFLSFTQSCLELNYPSYMHRSTLCSHQKCGIASIILRQKSGFYAKTKRDTNCQQRKGVLMFFLIRDMYYISLLSREICKWKLMIHSL